MSGSRSANDPGIVPDANLQALNTFGLSARALRLARIESAAQAQALLRQGDWTTEPRLVLGGGSNVVFTRDFPGTVLKVEIAGRALVRQDPDAWYVRAGGGENWHAFVGWTLAQGWPGLENLSLIPGTVGAAPIQNIGAYGVELRERFHCLEAVSLEDGTMREFSSEDCRFGYRDSVFKHEAANRWLIVAVTFRLPRPWQAVTTYAEVADELITSGVADPCPADIAAAIVAIRTRKLPDPAVTGNAGSFFKNPVVDAHELERLLASDPDLAYYRQDDGSYKVAAGWLIDRCGWKGRSLGPVGCFERQALVLVNHGGATGADVLRIAHAIQDDVVTRFGIELEPEPVLV
ncbi:MAG TPA: UDP-N-acetylmuramate dehydrogenase [Rhodocyclaceae bacterium]|nr:UDP-N-acetylmuramate dehydrogenase [Rhodocyclaceae bacterium]